MTIQAFIHAVEICPRRGTGQDRVAVVSDPDRVIIALADGAGGTSGGERAAMAVIEGAMRSPVDDWPMVLAELELERREPSRDEDASDLL